MKTLSELTREGARTNAAKNAIRQVDVLKDVIRDAKSKRLHPQYIESIKKQGLQAIKADLKEASITEQQRIWARMDAMEKAYQKAYKENLTDNRFNLERIKTKYQAMTDAEIHSEAVRIMDNPRGRDPLVMDFLSAEMRSRNIEDHAMLRDRLIKADYERPWLATSEGETLKKELAFYDHAKPGVFLVEGKSVDGEPQLMAARVEDLYDE
jgi:hypothetical protein